jgi:hypothetical protein
MTISKHFEYEIIETRFLNKPLEPPFDDHRGEALIRVKHNLTIFETVIDIRKQNIESDGSIVFSDTNISNAIDLNLHTSIMMVIETALREEVILNREYEVRRVTDEQAINENRNCRIYNVARNTGLSSDELHLEVSNKLLECLWSGDLFSRNWYLLKIIETYFETSSLHPMNGYEIGVLFERMNWKHEHEAATMKKYSHNEHLKDISAKAKPSKEELIELRREHIFRIGKEVISNSSRRKWNGKSLAFEMLKWMDQNSNFEGCEHFKGRGQPYLSEKKLAEMISKSGFWDN